MKKRVVALLLGVVMVMSTLAGCGAKEETTTKETTTTKATTEATTEATEEAEDPAAHEFTYTWTEQGESGVPMWDDEWWKQFAGTKLTIAFYKRELDESKAFEDKPIVRDIEKLTGMDLEWIPVDSGSKADKVATMLADPKNMPDIFQGPLAMSDVSANVALFADLSQPGLLDTYGRHIQGRIDEVGIQANLTQTDGSIRTLAANCGEEYGSSMRSLGWINMTWCEKVGKEFPTTWDEFVDVLRAFKTGDPNGNGEADEIPFSFNEANSLGIQNLANSFGISGQANGDYRYWINPQDGIVNSVCDTDAWREFLEVMHSLVEEGLVDVEGFSDTYEQYTSKLAMDRVGFFYGWSPSNLQVPNQEDWRAIEPFTYGDYEYSKTSYHHVSFANLSAWAISAACENKEAALLYIDLLHSSTHWAGAGRQGRVHPDYIVNKSNGRLQFGWTAEERTAQFGDLDSNIVCYSQGLGENCALLTVLEDGATFETQVLRGQWYKDKDGNPTRQPEPWERNYVWDVYHQYVREGENLEVQGSKFTSAEATLEKSTIETDLYPYIRTFMADAVINGIDDAKWDTFVDGLDAYGYYKWIDWWQRSYNGEI